MNALGEYQSAVVHELNQLGIAAHGEHSGGGIFGIQIELDTSYVFTTLHGDAWTNLDWNDENTGDLIACVEVQARPFGNRYELEAPAQEMATALARVVNRLDNAPDPTEVG